MPSSHHILCRRLFFLPLIPPSIRVFSNESTLCMKWPQYWSFSFSISPSKEHPGLTSFRMDWLDLLLVQGTLQSLLPHHNSKASILQHSAFFTVQLSHPYMTTGKTVALTRWAFVGKVMPLLFNMLSRLVSQKRGQEELPHVRGQGRQPRGATARPRSGGCAGAGEQRGDTPCSRSGGRAHPPDLIQGKEQWLHFAGKAVKRYPTSKVRETQVRR